MTKVNLKQTGVIFDATNHTYTLKGQTLSGITGMLQRQLFPDEFAGISDEVLNAAADYGTSVHESIERFDLNWADNDGTQEVADYIDICLKYGLNHEASEYNVTDGKVWASNIDKVYRTGDDTFTLADIKTYGQMTPDKREKVRWQLSIYAYLFELVNKKAHVDKLLVLHIRNKQKRTGGFDHIANAFEVTRIPAEIVKDLLDTDAAGGQFKNPYAIPDEVRDMEQRIRELTQQRDAADKELAEIKAKILADMVAKEQKTWATDTMRITRKYESTRAAFDLKRFRVEHPDIDFTPYESVTRVAGSITITI